MNTTLFLAMTLAAPALKDPPKKDVNLVGEWIVESQITNGRQLNSTYERRYSFTNDGQWSMTTKGKAIGSGRTFTIDTKTKPAAIDLKLSAAATAAAYTGIV